METTLEQRIEAAHSDAERVEIEARQIEARICQIAGADRYLPVRTYGKPVSGAAISQNLTLRSLIADRDPKLAAYLGIGRRVDQASEALVAARDAAAAALVAETGRLQQVNSAAARRREQANLAGINPLTGRRWGS